MVRIVNFMTEFIISLRAKFRNAGCTVFEISIIKYIDSSAMYMETARLQYTTLRLHIPNILNSLLRTSMATPECVLSILLLVLFLDSHFRNYINYSLRNEPPFQRA